MTIGRYIALAATIGALAQGQVIPDGMPFPNPSGILKTYRADGKPIDLNGPFFQSLGSNGRSCASCHQPAQGWSVSAAEVSRRFETSQGLDPIFRTNDGSNCDHDIDTSSVAGRRRAYSLLTGRGVLRVSLPVPADAEFTVAGVVNPYGCSEPGTLSLYRRPLPAANLRFLSAVMWDARESTPETGTRKITYAGNPADLLANLAHQALDATNGHAQASTALTPEQQKAIVDFETGLYTAQAFDFGAGELDSGGAKGGPQALATRTAPAFFVGINDPLGENPTGKPFTPVVFDLFDAWAGPGWGGQGVRAARRQSIARGQAVFNSKPINITRVSGLNDDLGLPSIPGTCGTCHDSPNAGDHSVPAPLNIGVGDLDSPLDITYLPVITLQNKSTGQIVRTTDPGRALITGRWKDIGRMKGPMLRGLAARAPYFHNGSAASLEDVLDFYEKRFNIGFTPQEKSDLISFLNSL